MRNLPVFTVCGLSLFLIFCGQASAFTVPGIGGGVLTFDVEMTLPDFNGGAPFPAVVNPDYAELYSMGMVDESGFALGFPFAPDEFIYGGEVGLPVYTFVPAEAELVVPLFNPEEFTPWDYAEPLFGSGTDPATRNFSLARVGGMGFDCLHTGGGDYEIGGGGFFSEVTWGEYDLAGGGISFGLPPSAPGGWVWYDVHDVSITAAGVQVGFPEFAAAGVGDPPLDEMTMTLNNHLWTSGWPGATLDKNFFPADLPPGGSELNPVIPEPGQDEGQWFFGDVEIEDIQRPWWCDPPMVDQFEYVVAGPGAVDGVTLPTYPGEDKEYNVDIWDGAAWISVAVDVLAGDEISFIDSGHLDVTRFRITGIDPPADSADPMAFPLGITFSQVGTYDVEMTGTPEPTSLALMALVGAAVLRRRRRR